MIIADLHIHSKYSRATSRDCIPESLDLWARRKGIQLLGTGDFTHPAWRKELAEKLTPAEEGLYTLKDSFRQKEASVPDSFSPRFVISGEISSIYKKNEKVRKIHNLILLPSLEAAEELSRKLEAIGNIHSDGRPILGLDSRDLLEITLEACPDAIFVPAHIWTPHFSLFGAFSGFDRIEECFEDLTPHIRALETGLSSDPPMNWRLSALDSYHLISNSDAHSPAKLGREANLLDIPLSYPALYRAIQEGEGLSGTIEFFPEEGKYHYDGHRKCGLCLTPREAEQYAGKCPVCGRKLTTGVLHRVEQLADRDEGYLPQQAASFESLVPLPEVIGASTGHPSSSKKVYAKYLELIGKLGDEFYILRQAPLEDIRHASDICVEEGIRRLREGRVERTPGFDGEYGKIHLLTDADREDLYGQLSLFDGLLEKPAEIAAARETSVSTVTALAGEPPLESAVEQSAGPDAWDSQSSAGTAGSSLLRGLNPAQAKAACSDVPYLAVIAGPGTGKTQTLTLRIAYLIRECGIKPSEITAVTFTNRAASEMKTRLAKLAGGKRTVRAMNIGTFHSICLDLLKDWRETVVVADEYQIRAVAEDILRQSGLKTSPRQFVYAVSSRKNGLPYDTQILSDELYVRYQNQLRQMDILDFDDLILETLKLLESGAELPGGSSRFSYLFVDEYQDINRIQYRLIRMLAAQAKALFVIGDPDQSIYGFRGSDPECFDHLSEDFPGLQVLALEQNYRSTPEILECALSVIRRGQSPLRKLQSVRSEGQKVSVLTAKSSLSEGIYVAKEINRLVGGIDMLDAHELEPHAAPIRPRSFSEIAILYRTHRQAAVLEKCLSQEGIPYVVAGRDDFLADEKVRGTIGFFRWLLDPRDEASLAVCRDLFPNYRISVESLRPVVKKQTPQALLAAWCQGQLLQDYEPLRKLGNMAVFHKDLPSFLENLVLGQEGDLLRAAGKTYTSDMVTLMTLHGSKGLEFPVVFLCGVSEGKLPLTSTRYPTDPDEERRLFYVGMTRAEECLYLLTSPEPSVFLESLPSSHIRRGETVKPKPALEAVQLSLFDL